MPKGIPTWMKNAGGKAKNAVGDAAVAVKHGGERAIDGLGKAKQDLDIRRLRPVFPGQIGNEYKIPPFVQVVDHDKNFGKDVCHGAIGFDRRPNHVPMFAVSRGRLEELDLKFLPNANDMFFYIHPYDNHTYIAIDEYFLYLRKQRVAELEKIAYDLGAKHLKITYMEEKESFVKKTATLNGTGKQRKISAKADANHISEKHEYADVRVGAEMFWEGHDIPRRPKLSLYQDEIDIINLIDMRMENPSAVKSKTYLLNYNTRREMKVEDAIKIDGALKALKMNGAATLRSISEMQSRMKLEYEIEF